MGKLYTFGPFELLYRLYSNKYIKIKAVVTYLEMLSKSINESIRERGDY